MNVSSQASMAALKDHTLYSSAKGALDMLTKTMALELGPHGNPIHTPLACRLRADKVDLSESDESAGPSCLSFARLCKVRVE